MTTSYSVTRDQIIMAALRKIGIVEPSDTTSTIDTNIVTNAAMSLNLMLKQWMTEGIKLWTVTEYTLPVTASKTSYIIGPSGPDLTTDKPLKMFQAWIRNTSVTPNIDTPLQILSKQEYNVLGSKFSTGVTNSIFLDPGVSSSTVYLYLTPDTNTASSYQLHMVVQRPINDISLSTDVPDFPNEWLNALVWGLADELAIEFSVPANHRNELSMRAIKYREQLVDWDVENTSVFFQPNLRMLNNRSH